MARITIKDTALQEARRLAAIRAGADRLRSHQRTANGEWRRAAPKKATVGHEEETGSTYSSYDGRARPGDREQ